MGTRILLADDSITIQKVVNLTFADEGIEVVAVSNGDLAQRRLAEIKPDLVLADIFMPGRNGYELCEFIKQTAEFRSTPVVLLVGAFEPFDQAEARRVRADAHLTKPFESRTLVETVRRLISASGRPASGPLPSRPGDLPTARETAPRDGNPISRPSSHLDFGAMRDNGSSSRLAAESRSAGTSASAAVLDEPTALDFRYPAALGDSSPIEVRIESDPLPLEPEPPPVVKRERQTGELVSPSPSRPQPGHPSGFEEDSARGAIAPIDFEDDSARGAAFLDSHLTPQADHSAESNSAPFHQEPSTSDSSMVLDFETVESPKIYKPDNAVTFEVETAGASEAVQTEEQKPADSGNFETQRLEAPARNYEALTASASEPLFAASSGQSEQTATAALFSMDNPLGDILGEPSDGRAVGATASEPPAQTPADSASQSPMASADLQSPLLEVSLHGESAQLGQPDVLKVEPQTSGFAGSDASEPQVESSTRFSKEVEYSGVSEPSLSVEQPMTTFTPSDLTDSYGSTEHDFTASSWTFRSVDMPVEKEFEPGGPANGSDYGFDVVNADASSPLPYRDDQAADPSALVAGDPGHASSHTSAEPAGTTSVAPVDVPAPFEVADANFTSASMWTEEETSFAPIDVEPSHAGHFPSSSASSNALEEPEITAPPVNAASVASSAPEPDAVRANGSGSLQASPAAPAEISDGLIDEIARRVLERLGDAVTREIAWEVVPDCVERIVEKLTRESLAKRA